MIRKILFSSIPILFLFNLLIVSAQGITEIELLDIEKNKIITMPTNPKIQSRLKELLKKLIILLKNSILFQTKVI